MLGVRNRSLEFIMNSFNLSARLSAKQRMRMIVGTIAIGLMAPLVIHITVQINVKGITFWVAFADVLQKQFAPQHMLIMLSLFCLFPFGVLAKMTFSLASTRTRRTCYVIYLCGLIGILSLMIPMHVAAWNQMYGLSPKSFSGLLLLMYSAISSTATLFVGWLIGSMITRFKWFNPPPLGYCQTCGYDLTGNVSDTCSECGTTICSSV